MTPLNLVTSQTSYLARYDMTDKILTYDFSNILNTAHSINIFRRDLRKLYILNPSINSGKVAVDMSSEFRAIRVIRGVKLYSSYSVVGTVVTPGTEIISNPEYTEAQGENQFNYYSNKILNTYYIAGNYLNFREVPENCVCIEVTGIVRPYYGRNLLTGEWESDSWILEQHPGVIQSMVRRFIAGIVADPKMMNAAEIYYQQQLENFIDANKQEILPW
jgi:hypothetical protein